MEDTARTDDHDCEGRVACLRNTSHLAPRTSPPDSSHPSSRLARRAKLGYKELKIWLAGKELVKAVYAKLRAFPQEERYALCDQLRRAVVSVPSNIAEGYGRDTHKDFAHFLSLATGSLYEVATQLDIAVDLGYIKPDAALDAQIVSLAQMLASFRTRLLSPPTPAPHTSHLAPRTSPPDSSHLAPRTSH